MNPKTAAVFHGLLKQGWIDRREDGMLWSYIQDSEIWEELDVLKEAMGIDLYRIGDRVYLIPTQENDLFLKNNVDYKRDIRAENTIRNRDLYLMNYLAVYILYLFFSGEEHDPLCRDFITKEDLIKKFTEHCRAAEQISPNEEDTDYSKNFHQLAAVWCGKLDGTPISLRIDERYGVLNKLLRKFSADDLFTVGEDDLIRPTRRLKDLMPYFLRKDRIAEIQSWIQEGAAHAEN